MGCNTDAPSHKKHNMKKMQSIFIFLLFAVAVIGQDTEVQPAGKLYEQYPSTPPETTLRAPDWLGSFDSYAYTMPGIFLSGVADGLNQTLLFHYDKFKVRFPGARDQFWNPAISWENKHPKAPDGATLTDYEAFPFSTSLLVWTTDGHHLTRAADHFFIYGTVAVNFGEKKNWKRILIDGAAHFVVRSVAFNLTYNTLKK